MHRVICSIQNESKMPDKWTDKEKKQGEKTNTNILNEINAKNNKTKQMVLKSYSTLSYDYSYKKKNC